MKGVGLIKCDRCGKTILKDCNCYHIAHCIRLCKECYDKFSRLVKTFVNEGVRCKRA